MPRLAAVGELFARRDQQYQGADIETARKLVGMLWGLSAVLSAGLLYRAHRRRRLLLLGSPPRPRGRGLRRSSYRTRVAVASGTILLLLVSVPFVPAVAGLGTGPVRYSLQPRLTTEVTGQFLVTPRGPVKLFAWQDPQASYPSDALRLRAHDLRSLLVRGLRPRRSP